MWRKPLYPPPPYQLPTLYNRPLPVPTDIIMIPAPIVGPDMARSIELEAYATIGCTAVLLWDILIHVPEDYQQMRIRGIFTVSRIIYLFSRFACLFYMVALCVVQTVPIGNCAWVRYIAYLFPFTIPVTLLLFLCRVYVIFQDKRLARYGHYVPVLVFLSWLLVLGSSIVVAVRTDGMNINGTKFCTKRMNKSSRDVSDALSTFTRFFHDTLVFIVTSWWLFRFNSTDDHTWFPAALFGKHLVPLARSLLHDGQAYYLATLILNVVVIALPLLPKPFVSPCTLGGPLFVLISNMAAHVYRNLVNAKYQGHREFRQWEDGEWRTGVFEEESVAMGRVQSGGSSV